MHPAVPLRRARPRRRAWLALAAGLLALGNGAVRADGPACLAAITAEEQAQGIPAGLLLAIGRVETGRYDTAAGTILPWAWALNAAGQGRILESPAAAVAAARGFQAAGVRSIDVGCLQVNLLHHPSAFASLEEGFDPAANARYAGRFLVSLRDRLGSWAAAVAQYHSATPERGAEYQRRVFSHWLSLGVNPETQALWGDIGPQSTTPQTWAGSALSVDRHAPLVSPRAAAVRVERPSRDSAALPAATTASPGPQVVVIRRR